MKIFPSPRTVSDRHVVPGSEVLLEFGARIEDTVAPDEGALLNFEGTRFSAVIRSAKHTMRLNDGVAPDFGASVHDREGPDLYVRAKFGR